LEVLPSLEATEFIASFKRYIAHCGHPKESTQITGKPLLQQLVGIHIYKLAVSLSSE
jgi:hypothetical protein